MPRPGSPTARPLVWLGLCVLIALSLTFGLVAVRTAPPDIAASGPVIDTPIAPPPTPLPDANPTRGS